MGDGAGTAGALGTDRRIAYLASALQRHGFRVRVELDPRPTTWGDPMHGYATVLDSSGQVLAHDPHAQHRDADIAAVRRGMLELAQQAATAVRGRGGYTSTAATPRR
eukprot:TRINITY_DN29283_c0_g1_i3.p3 TRINITY_DN29283_c0_g1~~TRINITY_DN29283_c0_g1_i3.p3  ORF type:complete len:107 (+),score=21.40 TRINITY_DN29283_c0_g1_i3:312-632(+)